jgi:N-acetylglutamate synthase-like GNAT family acetyltransferase
MENKEPPKATGVSGITGKIVKVRHATEADMDFIMEYLEKYYLDTENLHYDQFVVATENGNPIGFGRLKKIGETYEVGCVVVIEERSKKGIGALIIKHLIDYSPVKMVYAITDVKDDFKKLGFLETKEGSQELMSALDKACRIGGKQNAILMVYKKD